MSEATPALRDLLKRMAESGASDLHLALGTPPVYRRHGTLEASPDVAPLTAAGITRLLEDATDGGERERLQRERELDKALDVEGTGRFRVNIAYDRGEPYMTFRRVNETVATIEELALPPVCDQLTRLPRGLVLATGPTGSGKSTTLASMIDRINERDRRHIVTIEDPIEYVHRNKRSLVHQREVGSDTRSFADALRHVLRQDPDVILVGEMRDLETMASAITAAETGHLVFATLHTPDAPQTIDRIVDAFPSHQQQQVRLQLAMVIEGIVSQVLIPTAAGDGRVAACEVMLGTPAIRNLIRESKTHQVPTAMATGAQHGMRTLDQELAALVQRNTISRDTAIAHARSPEELDRLLARPMAHAA